MEVTIIKGSPWEPLGDPRGNTIRGKDLETDIGNENDGSAD